MILKKMIVRAAALLVPAVLFGSCEKKEAAPAAESIELRVLNYMDLTSANAAQETAEVWDVFARNHPGVKIIREDLFNDPFHNKIEAYAATGMLPDVIYAWPSGRSTTLHTRHLLKDLGPFIAKDGLEKVLVHAAVDPNAQGAGYVAILARSLTSSHVFYINKRVLREAGLEPAKTYAELRKQVPALKAKGLRTVLIANKDTWVMQSCLFSLIAGRFCGEGWEKKILGGTAKFTDEDFAAALEFVKTMYGDGVISRETLTTDYGEVIGQFAGGKGAYLIDGDWRIGAFITDKTTGRALISPEAQKDIELTVFPDIEGAKLNRSTSGILGTGWGMSAAIPAGSAREQAAWELIEWLSGKETQTELLENGGITTPTRTDIDIEGLHLEPMQIAGGELAEKYDTTTVVIDGVFEESVYAPINDGLRNIGLGRQTPRQVAEAAQKAFETWNANR